MDDRTGSQEDLVFGGLSGRTAWSDFRNWSRRMKIFVAGSVILSVAILTSIIIVVATASGSSTVIPTPTPGTSTTTSTTTPSTTTSSTTTTTPTTTTTTSTTTPSTTTSSTTTTPTTTTSSTTTSPTTTTTTKPTTTTTKPTTTTTKPTTTTTKPTTTMSTTSTTSSPPFHPSTPKPIPKDWQSISAINLLKEMQFDANYTDIACAPVDPPTFRVKVIVLNHTWIGDSDTKKHAKNLAARNAVEEMFGLQYPDDIPKPLHECKEIS